MKLAIVECSSCAAPLPLAVPEPQVTCPHCGGQNALPADYVEAASLRQREGAARQRAEPLWRKLGQGAPPWSGWLSVALVILLPPLVTLVGLLLLRQWAVAEATALLTMPALLPGAGLWIWSGAVGATTQRYRAALAARPPSKEGQPSGCRNCGAPLRADAGALTATCGYCGVDSVLEQVPVSEIAGKLRQVITSLQQATGALRRRRLLLGLGTAGVALLVGGVSVLICLALLYVG